MSQKTINVLVRIIKWGLLILPLTALIVAGTFTGEHRDLGTFAATILMPGMGDMFFPFITGKNFFFRIVVEILFVLWVFAAAFDKKYRPTLTPVFLSVSAFIAVLVLSTIFGVDPSRSFWSNYERMEGLLGHIHLFLYFLIAVSVLKTERDWKWLFHSSIFVSILIAIYSFYQLAGRLEIHQGGDRIDATLGNATYLAVYMMVHLFIVLYFLLKENILWKKIFYWLLFAVYLVLLYHTATRGAILGFLGGMAFFGFLYSIFGSNKKYRVAALGALAAIILIAGSFYFLRDSSFVRNSLTLSRFREISFNETTTQSRFILWGMALKGASERPILGWGPENFNIIFSKYYDPRLWRQEPWFDRAHNAIFDWLTAGGILGFLAYLSIYASALWGLWRSAYHRKEYLEAGLWSGFLGGYLFQNIFVFDQLISYLLFFSIVAFLHMKTHDSAGANVQPAATRSPNIFQFIIPIAVIFLIAWSLYFLNMKPLMASRELLNAIKIASTEPQKGDLVLESFNKALAYNSLGQTEVREQLTTYATSIISSNFSTDFKIKTLSLAITEMEKQTAEHPQDPRNLLFINPLYTASGQSDKVIANLEKASELSPRRPQILFLIADYYLNKSERGKAIEILKRAYNLDPNYMEAVRNFVIVLILDRRVEEAEAILKKAYPDVPTTDQRILNAYSEIGRFDRVLDMWMSYVEAHPTDVQYRVNLAAAYLKVGHRAKAIESIEKAISLDPRFREQGEKIIQDIKTGKNL